MRHVDMVQFFDISYVPGCTPVKLYDVAKALYIATGKAIDVCGNTVFIDSSLYETYTDDDLLDIVNRALQIGA